MMDKIDVNGANTSPVWKWLKEQQPGDVSWNFAAKFIIDKDGKRRREERLRRGGFQSQADVAPVSASSERVPSPLARDDACASPAKRTHRQMIRPGYPDHLFGRLALRARPPL